MTARDDRRPGAQTFRALVEHGLDVLMLADADARLRYVSPSAERVLGFRAEEMVGTNGFDYTHPDEAEENKAALGQLVSNPGALVVVQYRHRHKAGHYLEMETTARNLLDDPDVGALVLSARDVTERNRARRKLVEQEARFRLLAENAHDIITIHQREPTTVLRYVSPSAERLLGYPLQRFYDDPQFHRELLHPDDAAAFAKLASRPAEELPRQVTLRWRRADGAIVWFEQVVAPLPGQEGDMVASIARDVTEKIDLERHLRRAEKMEALGRLAGGIAHDFSNLLGVVKLSVGRLMRQRRDDSPLVEDLGQIDEAVDRGVGLVRQLLAFSRHESNVSEVVDLARVIGDMRGMLRRLLPEDVELEIANTGERPWVRIAPAALEQLVLNLVVNARDAMPTGGTVRLEISSDGDRVVLSVVDNGVGIDPAERDKLVEPFYTTKDVGKGTGLGLTVVFSVVERSGGRFDIDSNPGGGTIARVDWPRADDAPALVHELPEVVGGRGRTILVVEDEPALRKLIAGALSALGYQVIPANDTDQALLLARDLDRPIDLLLTDVIMPGRSGPQLASAIRELRAELPILFMSGYTADALKAHAIDGPLLEKPFTEDELARAVRAAIDGGAAAAVS